MTPGYRLCHHRGFVLVLTVAALAVVSTSLLVTARAALADSLRARACAVDLQDRWLLRSTQTTLVRLAIDEQWETADLEPIAWDVRIGDRDIRCEVVVQDEQVKLNANALVTRVGAQRARSLLDGVAGASVGSLTLRPILAPDEGWPPLLTISQLGPRLDAGERRALLERVTLWSDGTVNVMRADPEVIAAAVSGLASRTEVDAVIEAVKEGADLEAALASALGVSKELERLAELVTDESRCFSVRVRLDEAGRTKESLAVGRQDAETGEDGSTSKDGSNGALRTLRMEERPE